MVLSVIIDGLVRFNIVTDCSSFHLLVEILRAFIVNDLRCLQERT